MKKLTQKLTFFQSNFAIYVYYLIFAAVWTYPVIFHLKSMIIGYHDAWQFIWNFWWVKTALLNGISPFFTTYLHWPNGISLLFHTLNLPNAIISISLQPIFGLPATYNILVLLNFALAGLSVYLLAKLLTKNRFASFVAGYVVTFSAYYIAHSYGHLNLMSFGWVVLFILHYLKMLKGKANWKLPVVFLILATFSDLYYAFYLALFLVLHLIFLLIFDRQSFRQKGFLKNYFFMIGLGLLLISPYIGTMVYEKVTNSDFNFIGHDPLKYSVDLVAYFIPNFTSIFKPNIMEFWEKWHYSWENVGYIGYSVFILIFYALFKIRGKPIFFWFFIFLAYAVLALGPYLQVNGVIYTHAPLPFYWVQKYIPFINLQGVPARFASFAYLAGAILVAFALSDILKKRNLLKTIIVIILVSGIFIEYMPAKMITSQIPVSDFYLEIAKDRQDYAIIDISYDYDRVLYYQTIHHKRLIGGYTSRTTEKTQDFLKNTPVINNVYNVQDFEEGFNFKSGIEILKHYKIKYILISKQDKKRLRIVEKLNLPIIFHNPRMTVVQVY
ncbi:MAG: hypothetical protein HW405_797 [Candidatus Berkelbacteria bacterium]|nr:hypothetical protein [Candidatus Berkelbacteria bacterium]